jgi:hypothetical protein
VARQVFILYVVQGKGKEDRDKKTVFWARNGKRAQRGRSLSLRRDKLILASKSQAPTHIK